MNEDDYRAAVRDAFDTELMDTAVELIGTLARIGIIADDLVVLAPDSLLPASDGDGPPDVDGMVRIWNALVRLRHELDAAQRTWKRVDAAAQSWTAVHYRPHFDALSRIADQEDDR